MINGCDFYETTLSRRRFRQSPAFQKHKRSRKFLLRFHRFYDDNDCRTRSIPSLLSCAKLVDRLRSIVGDESLLFNPDELLVYECDGFVVDKEEIARRGRLPDDDRTGRGRQRSNCAMNSRFRSVPRGAGTSLAGGCLPVGGGVMIALTRMRRILEVNYRDRYAIVEPGLVNVHLTQHLKGSGYHYAPDPSSQGACTIGGNFATNSGGPHTLKYGVTVNHVLGAEVVLPDGEVVQLGGPVEETPGYDLTGLFVGNEGTLGIATKIIVRLTRDPAAYRTMLGVFETVSDATRAISEIIGAGIVPAALEMMDQGIVSAIEQAFHFGFPLDAGAVLLIEVDGLEVAVDEEAQRIIALCNRKWCSRSAAGEYSKGAVIALEVPQAGLRSDRSIESQLLHSGWRRTPNKASRDSGIHHCLRQAS